MTKAKARRKGSVSPKKQTPPSKKKAARQQYPAGALADALQEVQQKTKSLRQIAKALPMAYGIPFQTLHRHAAGKTKSTSIGRQVAQVCTIANARHAAFHLHLNL